MAEISEISLSGLKGWGGWSLFFLALVWWIRGIPERKRAATEGETALRASYGEHIDRLTLRIDRMEAEHESDRVNWIAERTAMRQEHDAAREQWRRERSELLDHVAGLERKLQSYGSSALNIQAGGVNAPTTIKRTRRTRP
ncbi:hypothetical protein [Sphingomonas sp.]|uniref:hypothetical protein n=1 Tax=Sphingomonas sp. TaxID=28214 RepID=UPI003B3B61D5